ncbi:MAG: flagellar biosynthesis protein FlhB [Sphingomonas sp. SCN 67-18]|uniref:EscU/YscU/HrcU family type III secretion system export apparatus switch protein n=1 Tax=uncultured Sphingomonas sp. TaxID=158754 RepID=UPI00086FA0D5|nr:flagellar type III secretion system protein FlhB [Sphingomonas sp. SCN 67-18]ODU21604.1 MAG: flagellar biosynthesis protein FlhB [Sphingomonas sp. SCN 67-18]
MADESGEKTQAPTQKRKQDAIDKGEILRSKEFATAAVVLGGCLWLALSGPSLIGAFKAVMTESLQFGRADVEDFQPMRSLLATGATLGPALATLFAITIVTAIASQAGLGGARFNPKLLEWKGSRINPASGLKRMFGMQGLIELGKSLLKVLLLGAIGGWLLWSIRGQTLGLVAGNVEGSVAALGGTFIFVLLAMAGGLLLIAGIDVPIQIIRMLSKLRMSHQEVRDEYKETEGSPELKAALRQRQRTILKGGARQAVESAHVVLTNPTHFAVALRYERGRDEIPVVVAKGRGATALAIRELAAELSVPVLEYPVLARAVYYTSREGQQIRDDLYVAIATVLAFVFGVNQRAGGHQPHVIVPDAACFDENGQPLRKN